jgi:signal transduction histidine kinase
MLLIDVSIPDAQKQLIDGLRIDLAVAVGGALLVTLGLALLIHMLVTRRVEAFRLPLAEFAAGGFSARLPSRDATQDELDELAVTFNQMADELQRRVSRQEERTQLRQRAIVEERERIARELHDGMAQLLAYVNTKVVAARLMLKNGRIESATQNLIQLEGAARELFVDVRQAVLGLRAAGQIGVGLQKTLRDFAVQFSKFSDLTAEVHIDPSAERLDLSAEVELQLLRIVQEALTNVRKHASARVAQVTLGVTNGHIELAVSDDGVGFDVERALSQPDGQFGLTTMRERAEDIGAELTITSQPGSRTRLSVLLPTGEQS